MNLKKIYQSLLLVLIIGFLFSMVSMPSSEAYAAEYAKTLKKTVTLKPGESMMWILASKGKGDVDLSYEILSTKGVKKKEVLTLNFIDNYDEYAINISPVKKGTKDKVGAYAMKDPDFGTFALICNPTSGTVKIKVQFKVKSGKSILKTKKYTVE